MVEARKKFTIVLLERGVRGSVRGIEGLLEGFEPSVESGVGFLNLQLLPEKKIDHDQADEKKENNDQGIGGHEFILT